MINALIAQFWPYIALIAAAFAAFFGIRQSGKAAGRQELRNELNETGAKARKEARNVHNDTAGMADDAISSELKSRWVRDKPGRD